MSPALVSVDPCHRLGIEDEGPSRQEMDVRMYSCLRQVCTTGLTLLAAHSFNATSALAHGGRLDHNGCHHDTKRGGYHCHGGPRSEQSSARPSEIGEPRRRDAIPVAGQTSVAPKHGLLTIPATTSAFGRASVVDGDTIEIQGERIRLWGIDAPESSQLCHRGHSAWRCGQEAALALADHIGQRNVSCVEKERDRYGRMVATCSVADSNLSEWLVRNGWALDWPRYSNSEYTNVQELASADKVGIWQGTFAMPWKWRQGRAAGDSAD